ncbi:MAG: hypothetical protein ACYDB0_00985 [Acidithiobacillus sp.]
MAVNANETPVPADAPQAAVDGSFDAPITVEDVEGVIYQAQINAIRKAFSGSFFDVCPIPYDHSSNRPADLLVSAMHCKHFNDMSSDTKILLYRACLEICQVSSKEFPYPFAHDAPLCPFARSGAVSELTKEWSDADRARLRHKVGKHVGIAATVALIVGMVLGTVMTQPSDNRTIINVPRGGGYSAQRPDRFHDAPDGLFDQKPHPSRSALIAAATPKDAPLATCGSLQGLHLSRHGAGDAPCRAWQTADDVAQSAP